VAEVTENDRAHFARIADAKTQEREERLREALARPAMQRVIEGLELGYARPLDLEEEMRLDREALGQAELAMRGRRLGRRVEE
jgi:hypothetical protein